MTNPIDTVWMQRAIELARLGGRATAPNPQVGAVIVAGDQFVGEGWHQRVGAAHAEIVALSQAGSRARGATLYVTLEPCSHHGRTPPCVDSIVTAGIARVVVGVGDPDLRVSGAGLKSLQAQGVSVTMADDAGRDATSRLIEDYVVHRTQKRSYAVMKVAATLDGRIADRWGQARWITSQAARSAGRALRERYGAILVGAGTVIADDPELLPPTLPPEGGPFLRCVVDGALRVAPTAKLFSTASTCPVLIFTAEGSSSVRRRALEVAGAIVVPLPDHEGRVQPRDMLEYLHSKDVLGVIVEGGGHTHAQFLQSGLVDKVQWFLAPRVLGDSRGAAAVDGGRRTLESAWNLRIAGLERVGEDVVLTLYPS